MFEGRRPVERQRRELIARGTRELGISTLVDPSKVQKGYVVRQPKAYPVYDDVYAERSPC